jgi:hypothetical protein
MSIGGNASNRHFLDGFVDGIEPPFRFVGTHCSVFSSTFFFALTNYIADKKNSSRESKIE